MTSVTLPGMGGNHTLHPTLALVAELEEAGGSLFLIAEGLVQKTLGLADIIRLLGIVYQHAQAKTTAAKMTADQLPDFLLTQSPIPPASILADVLMAILRPLYAMEAVQESADTPLGEA
jgi:hypothetical protein